MSKSDYFENALLRLIFNATAIANIADNAATSPLTNLFWALHTADPADAGNQSSNEATYGSYARVPVARTTGGMTVSGTSPTSASPVANVVFATATSPNLPTTVTITHFSIGVATSGATNYLYSGTVSPNVNVSTGVQPSLTTASVITED